MPHQWTKIQESKQLVRDFINWTKKTEKWKEAPFCFCWNYATRFQIIKTTPPFTTQRGRHTHQNTERNSSKYIWRICTLSACKNHSTGIRNICSTCTIHNTYQRQFRQETLQELLEQVCRWQPLLPDVLAVASHPLLLRPSVYHDPPSFPHL